MYSVGIILDAILNNYFRKLFMPTLTSYDPINRAPLGNVPITEPIHLSATVLRAKQAQKS